MKHLIETTNPSGLPTARYDRIILDSATDNIIIRGGEYEYELVTDSYIYNEADNKYYQKLVGYDEPTEIDDIDLNSQWASDTTDNEYKYFKSVSYDVRVEENGYSYSQFKVTWSNLLSITFKYMTNSSADTGTLFVLKMDSEKFTPSTSSDDIYLSTEDNAPGTYNEFTIECDEGKHHIWFVYLKTEGATDEDCGFIGVPKFVSPILDVKQGAELPTERKYGGVSAENGKTYDIYVNNVTVPNDNMVTDYKNVEKTEKTITYEYVDLGLPSHLKWATCNIGATSETDYGIYFPWGETSGVSETLVGKYSDENYSWKSYKHCKGTMDTLTKYNDSASYGENPDNIKTLESVDDAANQIMGGDWRMPTWDESRELIDNTTKELTRMNGVNGMKFTSKTDESKYIFIPATGECYYGLMNNVGDTGYVWSSSQGISDPMNAHGLYFNSKYCASSSTSRCIGRPVRGVRK